MIELLILLGLAFCLRNWPVTPTDQDVCDYIVMDEFMFDDE